MKEKGFEARLEKDIAMQEALKIRQIMIDQVRTIGNLKLKDKILKIQEKVEGQENQFVKRRNIRTIISIAAAALILLFIGFQWFNTTPSTSNLYASNYESYDELRFGK